MTTLEQVELGVLGPLQVRQYGLPVAIPGAKPRAVLTMLGLHGGSVVSADTLVALLWGDDPPRTAVKALQTHISALRRTLGDGFVLTEGTGWILSTTEIDASRYRSAARMGRDAVGAGDTSQAVARFDEALTLWRGTPELPDGPRGVSEKTRWIEGHAALVEDRADALLATGRAAELIGDLEAAVADAPLRERRWGQLMLALYRAGRQGEALGAYQRARSLLADELGVDPGPDLRRLETAIVAQDDALEMPVSQHFAAVTRAVTFLLTDIEGSTAAWEADADAMAVALARHDEIVEHVVTSRGGRLIKTRGEGDATFSVFDRPSAAAAAAIELQEAIRHEPWALREPMRIRVALHTGEVELRDGDYFGRAVNRAARLRSLAAGGQILCSGATAELVIDTLSDDVVLADLGMRQLKNLARPEHVFELRLETAEDAPEAPPSEAPLQRPDLPAVLAGSGPFVGRRPELERLLSAWQTALAGGMQAVLIAGEPGVGKTRLAGEWSRHAYEQGAVVLYGRCDEDLGAPYQPFAEALRSLMPCLGSSRLRGLRGVEALLPLAPGLADVLPDLAVPPRADADTERYALFDAVVAVLGLASASAPVVLILDDLHWAAKPTLLLLRHLLRFGEHARVQVVGTYRSTDLDRSHPLAAMLADLHRDGSADRLALSGLDEDDVTAYVAEAGYDDEELARALASVTGGNPFFLIEALRHVDESGGHWDPSTLPQGVREAVSRRLSRLPAETNKALATAAVVGSRFALDLVERVVGEDLVDAFDEASKAGIVIEEPGGRYRFNHAIVRQSLLAELASVRRMRLHQKIAVTLETEPGADDELLAELAYHYFECAWAGNAVKAVDYCRRAADQAMARLAYEGAADLYDHALHALDELDEELPDRADQQAELLIARCEALLAAGDVATATGAVSQLQEAAGDSARLAAWGSCFDGQLSMLTDPERLDEIESALSAAAEQLAAIDDAAGEAKAHTVRAECLARLGRIGDAETALDQALTAARRAREHRRVNAVLANAPLAALWGPNPVPRAGGRCLDVVRLLRITTGSPVVEATSTRCQGVLDAFRGRAAAGRQLIDSARRSLTELGMRHALLEVDHFAGIVELVADDPAAAEPYLRKAYNGFRRMGLDADTAETSALLARACLALDQDAKADELCTESERLAGHGLKASIAWRTVRAELLARGGAHDEARRMAEEAVALAERTDLLVDHGDACLTLASVLRSAGDAAGSRAAAEKAAGLYELKGAAALAEKASDILGAESATAPSPSETPTVEPDNACVRVLRRMKAVFDRAAWDEIGNIYAPDVFIESRRKIVGFTQDDLSSGDLPLEARRFLGDGSAARYRMTVIAARGERLALTRLEMGTADVSPGAPCDESLQLFALDEEGRIALHVFFDIEDIDSATAELDAAYARLEERRPRAGLENAASHVDQRFWRCFAARGWAAMAELLTDDFSLDDRRQVVNAGIRRGRDAEIENVKVMADVGGVSVSNAIATRGDHLALRRLRFADEDQGPEAYITELLGVIEINATNRLSTHVVFDTDDIDAAFEELDARYLAGEAAPYANSWQTVMDTLGELNRHEIGPTLDGLAYADHRRMPFAPGDFGRAIGDLWALVPDARYRATQVHALDAHGAVISLVIEGTDTDGNELQWARILSWVFEAARVDVYEEDDLDAALAKFEELRRPAPRLENAAAQINERIQTYFMAGDWDALTGMLADDYYVDDRRRAVNDGLRRGRDAAIANLRAYSEVGVTNTTSTVIATRGERLALSRIRWSGHDQRPDAFHTEVLAVVESSADNQLAACVLIDVDDLDAAIADLDVRYLAGEAADYAQTWSEVAQTYATLNRRELPATTPDWVNIDHRRLAPVEAGHLAAYVRDAQSQWGIIFIEAVHRASDVGAVISRAIDATSQDGFDAEWREIDLLTFDGNGISRLEIFDEADLDAALAKFDELSRPAPPLENAASQVCERFAAAFVARDWEAIAQLLTDDFITDDRRRTVNAGIRHGRDAEIEDLRASTDLGFTNMAWVVIATRGERLALTRACYSGDDDAFENEVLHVVEIDADDRYTAIYVFDLDDLDAAFAELDARYVAGEAAAHSHIWSVIAQTYAGLSRGELPPTETETVDHRHVAAMAPGEGFAYFRAAWELAADLNVYIEAVHRLTDLGAVFTHVGTGTSRAGFEAEWRAIDITTVEGDLFNRCELFDEAELDDALAKFEEISRPAPRLENAASHVCERFRASFASRDWDALAETLADDVCVEDRRRVVNAGTRHGRDAEMANMRANADIGITFMTAVVIATRGERLVLTRGDVGNDERAEAFHTEVLALAEIDADERIAAVVSFDLDDIDAAFEELDARYLAGEAAPYAHTWGVIAHAYAVFNRRKLFPTTPDWVNVDYRRGTTVAPGDLKAFIRASWADTPDAKIYVEAVHRLTEIGAVATSASRGTSQEGFDAEWREIAVTTVDGDMIRRTELFDESDLDAALARFDELSRPVPPLGNTASRVDDRFEVAFAARDFGAMAAMMADAITIDDRRSVVNAGLRRGRDVEIANMRATADLGVRAVTSSVVATRGERLALSRNRFVGRDQRPDAFRSEALCIIEIDADERIVARLSFDIDDIDAAFAEFDARYLAGEAAAHAHTWSVIAKVSAAVNRHEIPPTTPHWVNVDHRRGTAFAPGEVIVNIRAWWDLTSDIRIYIEAVHRLSNLGAVVSYSASGISQEGFDAEWRLVELLTVEGDLINRCEIFDEADLDAALTRFDELNRPAPRLENAASRVYERIFAYFAARDWDAITEILAEDISTEDRRRVVNAGHRQGRDAVIAEMSAIAEVGVTKIASEIIATRGGHLVLSRGRASVADQEPDAFHTDILDILEIDADARVVARVVFDIDDIGAAFEELEARYLAGEAAAHPHTWSVIAGAYAAFNRREMFPTTPDWVNIDHRRGTPWAATGDAAGAIRAFWDLTPDFSMHVAAVHRLSEFGAVVTHTSCGTSPEGFEAEWRMVQLLAVDGDRISRLEIFDESELDAALTRFDELNRPAPRLKNAASHVYDRFWAYFADRDGDAIAELLGQDACTEDRRRVVNSGIRHGQDAVLAEISALIEVGVEYVTLDVIASRGARLALSRARYSGSDERPEEAFHSDLLDLVEIDADEQIVARVTFDLDDIDAAIEELEARYLAGEAAESSHAWSVVAGAHAALNRRELPATTPDWVSADHRRGTAFAPGDLFAYIRSAWDLMPDIRGGIEAVHRLSNLGAVVTHAIYGTSQEGFHAEWRQINLLTVDGDLIDRIELFDEADLDAALAKFDELNRLAPRLENAASRANEHFNSYLTAHDWDDMAEMVADDMCNDDRRRLVGAGVRNGRDAEIENVRTIVDVGVQNTQSAVIATRGERLALIRFHLSGRDQRPEGFHAEVLGIVEIDGDNRIAARVWFDLDDVDAAFEELDARYLAGEAAAHARIWSVVAAALAAVNRHTLPELAPDWVNIDHRRAIAFAPGELTAYLRATWDDAPDDRIYTEAVQRLSNYGAVVTQVAYEISQQGFEAEWRYINLTTVDGDVLTCTEIFDEADLDAALVRFDELHPQTRRLENAASRAGAHIVERFAARDWDAMAEMLADGFTEDDRRLVVNAGIRHGRDAEIEGSRAAADLGITSVTSAVVATRGDRVALLRTCYSDRDQALRNDVLQIVEVDAEERIAANVVIDPDHIEAAFEELDARYLTGEAAAHAHTWSVIARAYAALNLHEMYPTTPEFVNIDHRHGAMAFAPGDLIAYVHASWNQLPDLSFRIETVHRLSHVGAVYTQVLKGTSQEGFGAEWRIVQIMTVEGELVSGAELFDEADIDAALAGFEEITGE